MVIDGTVVNGQIMLHGATVIPDGTTVRVLVRDPVTDSLPAGEPGPAARLLALAGTVRDLPPDFALQHDHYRLGVPKRPTPTAADWKPDPEAIAFLKQLTAKLPPVEPPAAEGGQ
jgi:hypothetical protein